LINLANRTDVGALMLYLPGILNSIHVQAEVGDKPKPNIKFSSVMTSTYASSAGGKLQPDAFRNYSRKLVDPRD
jgi:hypothetical protein